MPDLEAPSSLPVGTIQMWSGFLSQIPLDYRLCDGNNGTPNLIAKFVKELPEGLDTIVGERGGRLSLGQKQLVSFARTLITDPKILLF